MNDVVSPRPVFVPPVTPRSVSFGTYAGPAASVILFVGALFTFVGAILTAVFLFAGGPFWEDWTIDRHGVAATALPDEAHATNTRINRSTVWEISFHYLDADGIPHSGTVRTADWRVREQARDRKPFPIHYVPGDYRLVRADGTKSSVFGLFAFFPVLFAALGLALGGGALRGTLRRRHLYRMGTPTTGRVVSVGPSNVTVNNQRLLKIRYTFNGPMGPIEGTMLNAIAPPEGSEVTVLYDPNDPGHSVLPVPGAFGV